MEELQREKSGDVPRPKAENQGIAPSFLANLVQVLAFGGTMGLYALICVQSRLIWLYVPVFLVSGRWLFPLVCGWAFLVAAAAPWIASEMPTAFLAGQFVIVLGLLVSRRLAAPDPFGKIRGTLLRWTGRAIRNVFILIAGLLLLWLALFRSAPIVVPVSWAGTLLAFVWKAPWPAPRHPSSWKQKTVNGALLGITTLLCLVGLELAARMLYPAPPVKQPARAGFESHPQALWTLRPGRTDTYATMPKEGKAKEFEVTVSSQGLRERELGPKGADEFRIVALGDSLTMGWGVSHDQAYPYQLEELLQAQSKSKHITVINAGVAGYGPWQERIFLDERCFALDPDLVILQVYPENDVHNTLNRTGDYLESYNQSWEEMVLYWRYQADWRMQADWWLLTNCRLYSEFRIATGAQWDMTRVLRDVRWLPPVRVPKLPPNAPRPFALEMMLDQWYPQLTNSWNLMKTDIRGIRDECTARKIGFFAFCLPSWTEVSDDTWTETVNEAQGHPVYERFKDVRLCESFFQEASIPYANVTTWILDHGPPERLYMNDGHFSPNGNRVLAERIANVLTMEVLPKYGLP